LKDRTGSSSIAIKKHMQAVMPADKKWSNAIFLSTLKRLVADGDLVQVKNSYKLSADFKNKAIYGGKKGGYGPGGKKGGKKGCAPSTCVPKSNSDADPIEEPDECDCTTLEWVYVDDVCKQSCDVHMDAIASYGSVALCCQENYPAGTCVKDGSCGVIFAPVADETDSPTPGPSQGSTPMVSTEITGAPTVAPRPTP
ncbi:hypothetical protein ACHAWF_005160, partial [Thalassiosira exigua]